MMDRRASRTMDRLVYRMMSLPFKFTAIGGPANELVNAMSAAIAEANAYDAAASRMVDEAADALAAADFDFEKIRQPTRQASDKMNDYLRDFGVGRQLALRLAIRDLYETADNLDDDRMRLFADFLVQLADAVEFEVVAFAAWRAMLAANETYIPATERAMWSVYAERESWPDEEPGSGYDGPPVPPLPDPPSHNGTWHPIL